MKRKLFYHVLSSDPVAVDIVREDFIISRLAKNPNKIKFRHEAKKGQFEEVEGTILRQGEDMSAASSRLSQPVSACLSYLLTIVLHSLLQRCKSIHGNNLFLGFKTHLAQMFVNAKGEVIPVKEGSVGTRKQEVEKNRIKSTRALPLHLQNIAEELQEDGAGD